MPCSALSVPRDPCRIPRSSSVAPIGDAKFASIPHCPFSLFPHSLDLQTSPSHSRRNDQKTLTETPGKDTQLAKTRLLKGSEFVPSKYLPRNSGSSVRIKLGLLTSLRERCDPRTERCLESYKLTSRIQLVDIGGCFASNEIVRKLNQDRPQIAEQPREGC